MQDLKLRITETGPEMEDKLPRTISNVGVFSG